MPRNGTAIAGRGQAAGAALARLVAGVQDMSAGSIDPGEQLSL